MSEESKRFDWGTFFLVIFDLLAASTLFFLLFGVAIFSDYLIHKLVELLDMPHDNILFYVRKSVKYFIVAADAVIVLAFIIKGVVKTWRSLWRQA